MNQIAVRQAALSDLKELSEMFDEYRQFYGKSSDIGLAGEFLRTRFNHGESTVFIAHAGEVPAGFLQLYPSFSSVSAARTFILNDLYVRPSARRKGAATQLMAAAETYAHALGAVRLTLSTAISNEQAQALYMSSGWVRDEHFYVFHRAIQA